MIEWPIAVFLLSMVALQEIWGSGQGMTQTFKKFYLLSSKAKTPSRAWSALLFATLASICFAFWESILRFMLQSTVGAWLPTLGASLLFAVLGTRAAKYREQKQLAWPMRAAWWTAIFVGFALLVHAWVSAILLGGWVYWRSLKALPK